jgi:hypothetical protein
VVAACQWCEIGFLDTGNVVSMSLVFDMRLRGWVLCCIVSLGLRSLE